VALDQNLNPFLKKYFLLFILIPFVVNAGALLRSFRLSKYESAGVCELQCKIDIIYWPEIERCCKQQHTTSVVETHSLISFSKLQ
jgi:hypothetical protein